VKIKTIVFDLGGVLFTEGKSVALKVLGADIRRLLPRGKRSSYVGFFG
jgi:hypothetical protein